MPSLDHDITRSTADVIIVGGIAAAVTEGDSAEAHAADTIALMTERSRCGRSRRRSSSGPQCDQRNR